MNASSRPRYLTKSRFKLATECPTKLFYTGKPDIYPDAKQQDEFLAALAEGGFQVGELAKLMYSGGIEVTASSHSEQIGETRRLLQADTVTIFEAAIHHEGLFARVDILRKTGAHLELIEVKAKSFDGSEPNPFRGARGGIDRSMRPYLLDVAFQRHVLGLAFPDLKISSFLMLVDKSSVCTVDGLNQRFKIRRVDGRPVITVTPGTDTAAIGAPLLTAVNVNALVDELLRAPLEAPGTQGRLPDLVEYWAQRYQQDEKISPSLGRHCADCEFRVAPGQPGVRSGLRECWHDAGGVTEQEFAAGTILDLWKFRGKQDLIEQGVLRLSQVTREDIAPEESLDGLTTRQRQWMQVAGTWPGDRRAFYLDEERIRTEFASWTFPLHFVDFETARVAIPFFARQRPYANIAFQFSHHVVEADGRVEHRSQFLSATPGRKPNYDFVRALQAALGSTGTVLMWSTHENTTLNAILLELEQDPVPPSDVAGLSAFLRNLTTRKVGKSKSQVGDRALVDLCRLAEKAFFHPATKGSNSIKKVLPAVMQSSDYLKSQYSQPIYGRKGGIRSQNFVDQVWWQEVNGVVADPYQLLPPVFTDLRREVLETLEADDDLEIAQGGAATTAYARLQFEQVAPQERRSIEAALLRYCELDTMAMVMIFEAWREFADH